MYRCDYEMMDELCEIEAHVSYVKEFKPHNMEAEVRIIYDTIGKKHYTTWRDFCEVYGFDEYFCCCGYIMNIFVNVNVIIKKCKASARFFT